MGLLDRVNIKATDIHLSYLPMAHAFENAIQIAGLIRGGRVGFYSGNTAQLVDDLLALRPTVLIGACFRVGFASFV